MKYHLFLTRKYLASRVIAVAAVVAMALGVFALMVTLTVMEGFKVEMRDRIRGTLAHLQIRGAPYGMHGEDEVLEILERQPHVESAAPFVDGVVLFKHLGNLETSLIRGIDVSRECDVGNLRQYMLRDDEVEWLSTRETNSLPDGRLPMSREEVLGVFSLDRRREAAVHARLDGFELQHPPQAVVVGIQAVKKLRIRLYQTLQLSSYSGLTHKPCQQQFIVTGVFQTGLNEQDMQLMIMPIRAAQGFLDLWDEREGIEDFRYSGVSVRLDDYENAHGVAATLESDVIPIFPGNMYLEARTWEDSRRTLLAAVDIEKTIVSVIMLFVVLFASVVIFVILWLLVIEKTRDLGVLASLGAPPGGVVRVFTLLGMILCLTGAAIGLLGGWLFTANINAIHDWITRMTGWKLFPPDIYYLTELPVAYTQRDMLVILVPTVVFGFLGSLIPAVLAARKDPIRALRHE